MPQDQGAPQPDDTAAVSRFYCAQGFEPAAQTKGPLSAFCSLRTAAQQVQEMIDADPAIAGKAVMTSSFDEKTLRGAATHLNDMRQKNGLPEIPAQEIDAVIAKAADYHKKYGDEPVTIPGSGFRLGIAPEGFARSGSIADPQYLVMPPSEGFRNELISTYGTQGALLHEAGHAVTGGVANERTADMTMALARIARGEEGMADKLGTMAAWRTLQPGTMQSQAADDLLRLRHELLTDPDSLKASLKGKTLSALADMGMQRVYNDAGPHGQSTDGAQRGMDIAIAILRPKPENAAAVDDLKNLGRDTAITLLRTQMTVEEKSTAGKDNPLTKIMPQLWKDNPAAFQQAQAYLQDNYGIKMSAPQAPAIAPEQKPAPRTLRPGL